MTGGRAFKTTPVFLVRPKASASGLLRLAPSRAREDTPHLSKAGCLMRRIADSTYRVQIAADLRGSGVARRVTRSSPGQSRLARSNRTAEPGRLIAADQPVRNAGLAVEAVDDFPEAIPVTARELEVIETYLNAVLDELSGRAQSDMTDEPENYTRIKKVHA